MGIPLHCIKDIRALYKKDLWETTPIDFDKLATPLVYVVVVIVVVVV